MSKDDLDDFFEDEGAEALAQKSLDNVNDFQYNPIKKPGTYLVKIDGYAKKDKEDENNLTIYPGIRKSPKKGTRMLHIKFSVVDGAPGVPKGSSIYTSIPVLPKSPNKEALENILKVMRPRVQVLVGKENKIYMNAKWLREFLTAEYELKDDKPVLVRDHKMKNNVLIVVDEDEYKNDGSMKVVDILPAEKDSVSVVDEIEVDDNQEMADMEVDDDFDKQKQKVSEEKLDELANDDTIDGADDITVSEEF